MNKNITFSLFRLRHFYFPSLGRLVLSTKKLMHQQSISIIVFTNFLYFKYFLFTKCSQRHLFFEPYNSKRLVEQKLRSYFTDWGTEA